MCQVIKYSGLWNSTSTDRRSQWASGLRPRSAAARLLRSWVRIPPGTSMFVCCECCVLSGRGLCVELITHPEEFYRLWCVVVYDLEISRMRRPWPTGGLLCKKKTNKQKNGTSSKFLHAILCNWPFTSPVQVARVMHLCISFSCLFGTSGFLCIFFPPQDSSGSTRDAKGPGVFTSGVHMAENVDAVGDKGLSGYHNFIFTVPCILTLY